MKFPDFDDFPAVPAHIPVRGVIKNGQWILFWYGGDREKR